MPFSPQSSTRRVLVIGGGPAGILASGTAAQYGARVILIERNNRLGVKLALTGQGRCNLTNSESDIKKFIAAYGKPSKFLFSALTAFPNQDTIQFFESLGVSTKTEAGGRVFPKSDKATEIIAALSQYLAQNKVKIEFSTRVVEIVVKNNHVCEIITEDGRKLQAEAVILATGGKSYPQTGSTGDGYQLAEKLGIKIRPLIPALVPLEIAESWAKQLPGVAIQNIKLTITVQHRKVGQYNGDLIFTHYGISGPVVLDSS